MAAKADLKRRLRAREPLFGCWTSIGHPSITEIFAKSGADFIGVDMEHSTTSQEQAQRIIAASQAEGVPSLPRVSSHNGEQIRRLLDSGADGILVPNVAREEEIHRIAEWFLYPPEGKRGYGVGRAQGYGFDFARHTSGWNRQGVLLIQIESIEGVEAAEELLAHPAVDGAMVGPYDISGSLGIPGQLDHPRVQKACARVVQACRKQGKACGTQVVEPTPARVKAVLRRGYTFVMLASDVFVLWKWSEAMGKIIRAARH